MVGADWQIGKVRVSSGASYFRTTEDTEDTKLFLRGFQKMEVSACLAHIAGDLFTQRIH